MSVAIEKLRSHLFESRIHERPRNLTPRGIFTDIVYRDEELEKILSPLLHKHIIDPLPLLIVASNLQRPNHVRLPTDRVVPPRYAIALAIDIEFEINLLYPLVGKIDIKIGRIPMELCPMQVTAMHLNADLVGQNKARHLGLRIVATTRDP